MRETDEEKKKTMEETLKNETIPFYFSIFDEIIQSNGGYLVGDAVSINFNKIIQC